MEIYAVAGFGSGRTKLSAFDAALKDAGVYNYNLITLSSIIPQGSKVVRKSRLEHPYLEYGHKLYVVKAEVRSERVGKFIAAGLGWYQKEDGRGVFVEHEEEGETAEGVKLNLERKLRDSLTDLCRFRGFEIHPSKFETLTAHGEVKAESSCALVVAVYKSEGWD